MLCRCEDQDLQCMMERRSEVAISSWMSKMYIDGPHQRSTARRAHLQDLMLVSITLPRINIYMYVGTSRDTSTQKCRFQQPWTEIGVFSAFVEIPGFSELRKTEFRLPLSVSPYNDPTVSSNSLFRCSVSRVLCYCLRIMALAHSLLPLIPTHYQGRYSAKLRTFKPFRHGSARLALREFLVLAFAVLRSVYDTRWYRRHDSRKHTSEQIASY